MDIKELEGGITTALNEATVEVFSTMLMMEVKAQDSFVKDEKNVSTDLISSLHFFGDKYMGKIAIFSSAAVACNIANAMLGTETTEVNEEIKDGMGELVNMIAGVAKVKLTDTLGDMHLLTPWVIAGRHLSISSSEGGDTSSDGVDFALDSQASFSWVMSKVEYDKGVFLVGVQPNAVPEENKASSIANRELESLKEEIKELKAVIERSKSKA
ncbi:MAG: chemotaxis protein CheX [Candidatus Scalindua sp.]|jgi:chemotaxis protein CheX|nr:chemotaxis protein CheX [Candidatus Scalindua sp.]MBT5307228.1 chemotaxis protein CheX [Candidatus Scalindua sp.]MBT6229021.1 chemotaxis protein CheX [Candidatus Scalindua sp.]MBT6563036.1 chemotaxis protein CheX [Candidatus Scalindua sp.]MBT7210802.1 chemotaxis protein CheX [Candidatus Scalindua sp.]